MTKPSESNIASRHELLLITGAAGFLGARVVERLLKDGFRNLRCFVRPSSDLRRLNSIIASYPGDPAPQLIVGNLLNPADCLKATERVSVLYHLAAGTGSKSFSDAFMNSVVTTRNLLEASLQHKSLKRFVNLSSFAVYTNRGNPRAGVLDETCRVEPHPESRAEAYCYAKVKQDQLVAEYGKNHGVPFVLLRPGVVYGPGKRSITGRIGIDTFGLFLHFGGGNPIPFTFVDNCAQAVVLAGLKPGIDGEVFNIVDDELPSSRRFLRLYKNNVRRFKSLYIPHPLSYLFCWAWEKYSDWSQGQLPPVFSRREWSASWKRTRYPNDKLKHRLGWSPEVPTGEGLKMFFESCRERSARN